MKENEKLTTEMVSEENEKSEKKKIVRQPWWPDWFTGRTINEPIFCREFLRSIGWHTRKTLSSLWKER